MKPIIFSTPMVQAILNGKKTQTRRIIKPHNKVVAKQRKFKQGDGLWVHGYNDEHIAKKEAYGSIKDYSVSSLWMKIERYIEQYAPYKPGDTIWVRETWCYLYDLDGNDQIIESTGKVYYAADNPEFPYNEFLRDDGTKKDYPAWNPSIHMPRTAARLFLRVTDVQIERLQDISNEDIRSEGITINQYGIADMEKWLETTSTITEKSILSPDAPITENSGWWRVWFRQLWDGINGTRDNGVYASDKNPFVWVITFERIEQPLE